MARPSTISSISGSQLGSPVTVNLNSESSSYQHKVEYYFENSVTKSVAFGTGSSFSFTPPLDLATQIPNSEFGTLTVIVTTFNGLNPIGTAYGSVVLKVPDSVVPTLSGITATRVDNGVPSSWGVYVKGISKVKITAGTASGVYGSTITSCNINGQGLHVSGTSGESSVLSYSGKQTYSCMVIDSRGRYTSKSVEINVVDYAYPTISVSAVRCKSDGTVSADGTYLKVKIDYSFSSVSGKNSITAKSCSCNGVSNSSFASGTAFILSANCAVGNQYTLTASIKDGLGKTASMNVIIPTAYRVLNVNKNKDGVAIGKFSEKAAFEVNMDSYCYGNIRASENISFNGMLEPSDVASGQGSSDAFMHLCRLKINGQYINQPIEICYQQRGLCSNTILCIMFESTNSMDPYILNFRYKGFCRGAYIVKSAASTWDIYIKKSEPWELIAILYWSYISTGISLEKKCTNANSVPTGFISAADFYLEELRDKLYPVGAIYLSWNDNNPGNFLGGTWVRMAEGRGLFGIGTSKGRNGFSGTVEVHEEFGNWRTTLVAENLPPHNHTIGQSNTGAGRNDWGLVASGAHGGNVALVSNSNATTGATGGGESFYTVPPYIGIYVWRRTA